MSDLSVLAGLVKKMQGQKNIPATAGRNLPHGPALKGQPRGAISSTGAVLFKGRNAHAAEDKDQEFLKSPIMRAYLKRIRPSTPITDWMKGGM